MARRIPFILLILLIVLPAALSSCAGSGQPEAGSHNLKMAPMSEMPDVVKNSPVSVQEAYRFNVANPVIMQQIPCYCGCGSMGHTSNYDCYVQEINNGKVIFDNHALGCSICVDITADAMRMLKEGKQVIEIKQAIDVTYSKFGPSNIQ